VLYEIWLVIELGRDILPTNNVTKIDDDPFHDYTMKTIEVTERTNALDAAGRLPARRTCSHNTPRFFFKQAYKNNHNVITDNGR